MALTGKLTWGTCLLWWPAYTQSPTLGPMAAHSKLIIQTNQVTADITTQGATPKSHASPPGWALGRSEAAWAMLLASDRQGPRLARMSPWGQALRLGPRQDPAASTCTLFRRAQPLGRLHPH